MIYKRMAIEKESPEELGYGNIQYNLAESSVSDLFLKDIHLHIQDLSLCYTDHRGKPELRELIGAGHPNLNSSHVLLTVGAASALFIIATTLLTRQDHLIVMRPNYATNIETPVSIGCDITYLDLEFESGWQPDLDYIEGAIRGNTKLISITNPHNPTGVVLDKKKLESIIEIAERNQVYLLVDETYRDLNFTSPLALAASLSRNAISVSSVSKAYGLPGIRLGWLITQEEQLMESFLAAKEQIFITNSVLDEEVAYQFLQEKENHSKNIRQHIASNLSIIENWINNEQRLEWVKPGGGVVCFPRVKDATSFEASLFYDNLLNKHGTLVGPGHWFSMPDHYMRIGYAWPTAEQLKKGLESISQCLSRNAG